MKFELSKQILWGRKSLNCNSGIAVAIFIIGYLALLLLNHSFLFNPPYGNDVTALHRQAIWLANNHFDIISLWSADQVFPKGGANAYPFGVFPYFYGILYCILSPVTVHFIGHLLNTAFIVAAFSICYFLIAEITGGKLRAFAWSLAALATPVIQGRSADIGHESPLLFGIMLLLLAIFKRRPRVSLCILASLCFIKMSALVICVAFICWLLIIRQLQINEFPRRRYIGIAIGSFVVIMFLYSITAYMDRLDFLITREMIFSNLRMIHYLMPLTGISIAGIIIFAVVRYRQAMKAFLLRDNIELAAKDRIMLLLAIMTAAFWLAFILYPDPCPRNAAMIVFPMAVFWGLVQMKHQLSPVLAVIVTITGLLLAELNIPALPDDKNLQSSDMLERNLAFVSDLNYNLEVCRFIEQNGRNGIIVAQRPFALMLSIPEMGYVRKPLNNVYCADFLFKDALSTNTVKDRQNLQYPVYILPDSYHSLYHNSGADGITHDYLNKATRD